MWAEKSINVCYLWSIEYFTGLSNHLKHTVRSSLSPTHTLLPRWLIIYSSPRVRFSLKIKIRNELMDGVCYATAQCTPYIYCTRRNCSDANSKRQAFSSSNSSHWSRCALVKIIIYIFFGNSSTFMFAYCHWEFVSLNDTSLGSRRMKMVLSHGETVGARLLI